MAYLDDVLIFMGLAFLGWYAWQAQGWPGLALLAGLMLLATGLLLGAASSRRAP